MSHRQERKEKDCLNCGTMVQGRYCHQCGQENVLVKESFGHLATHFLYDITHFDSKFFDSLRFLLFRPGFLPKEYMLGRRNSYLNPVKMYVFTSAFFFIIFFSLLKVDKSISVGIDRPLTTAERLYEISKREAKISQGAPAADWEKALQLLKDTTTELSWNQLNGADPSTFYTTMNGRRYFSLRQYDSVQQNLSSGDKDNWFQTVFARKVLSYREKYRDDLSGGIKTLFSSILHKLPYVLFVSLPLFALMLKLLYFRRKEFYYEDHAIFSVYHYIFSFMLLLVVFLFGKLSDFSHWAVFDYLTGILFMAGGLYLFLAMKRFYKQGWMKTLLKFVLLNIAGIISLITLFSLFVLLSVFEL